MTELDLLKSYPSAGFEREVDARAFVANLEKLGKYHGTVFRVELRDGRYVVLQDLPVDKKLQSCGS